MKTYTVEIDGRPLVVERDDDGKFLVPEGWRGVGSALKPANEPICLARKPLTGTIAQNLQQWGTGALNIDGCRVASDETIEQSGEKVDMARSAIHAGYDRPNATMFRTGKPKERGGPANTQGRWPANIVHDGSDEVVAAFPDADRGASPGVTFADTPARSWKNTSTEGIRRVEHGDSGSAARFFYTAKADSDDRIGSKHPTVKPIDLMQWLVRLVTPPGGVVLDPFAGTGTTAEAAFREGMRAVLIEREEEYQADIRRRMALVLAGPDERQRESIKASGKTATAGPLFESEWDTMWKEPWIPAE